MKILIVSLSFLNNLFQYSRLLDGINPTMMSSETIGEHAKLMLIDMLGTNKCPKEHVRDY